ncbi:MAG: hypothetical protein IPM24_19545 [Bryobacterales bacterium]|nr:hypothetical protein [Bryobacterales bacterium]
MNPFRRLGEDAHPSKEQMLLFLDGELKPARASEIGRHLEQCWQCRAWRGRLERGISDLVDYRDAVRRAIPPSPPSGWRTFDTRLRMAAEPRGWHLFRKGSLLPAPGLLGAALIVLGFVAVWVGIRPVQTVSAKELLDRIESAESEMLGNVASPVIYQRVHVSRRSESSKTPREATIEIWNETATQKSHKNRQDVVWDELEQVLRANDLPSHRPLAASTFATWRRQIRVREEEVTATKGSRRANSLTLRTLAEGPFRVHAIKAAALEVNTGLWRPVSLRLDVQGEGETVRYQIQEEALDVVPVSRVPTESLRSSEPEPPVAPSVETDKTETVRHYRESGVTREVELAVHYVLHRMGLCQGAPVRVDRSDSAIFVRGLVESEVEKRALASSLALLPNVRSEVLTVEEATARDVDEGSAPETAMVLRSANPPPIQRLLTQYFEQKALKEEGEPAATIRRSLGLADAMLSHAWALRRLPQVTGTQRDVDLPDEARARLGEMIEDHTRGLRDLADELIAVMDPIFAVLQVDPAAIQGGPPANEAMFSRTASVHELVQLLFLTGEADDQIVADAVRKLRYDLDVLRRLTGNDWPKSTP